MTTRSLPLPAKGATQATASFDVMYRRNFRFVWRVLRHSNVVEADLDDAVHEVFLIALRKWNTLEEREQLRPWLLRVARNVGSRKRRRRERAQAREAHAMTPAAPADPERVAAQQAAHEQLQHFLNTLRPQQRDIFVAVEIGGMSVPQACEALNVRLNTAYSRLRAARLAFRNLVERLEAEEMT